MVIWSYPEQGYFNSATGHFVWLVRSPLQFVRHLHYHRSKTCSRHICSLVPTSLTSCFAEYEQRTLYGALVVTLAMLLRLINCRFIITIIITVPSIAIILFIQAVLLLLLFAESAISVGGPMNCRTRMQAEGVRACACVCAWCLCVCSYSALKEAREAFTLKVCGSSSAKVVSEKTRRQSLDERSAAVSVFGVS